MLSFLPGPFLGVLSFMMYTINTLFWFLPIFIFALFKLIPVSVLRRLFGYLADRCASGWVVVNTGIQLLTSKTRWDVEGVDQFSSKGWYLVIANHQSWVDILVLQRVFSGRAPFLKFFLKHELIWVPVLGIAWWALDFPFMKRYNKTLLKKKPHLKGKDMETTRIACEKFKDNPVSVMNFVEGTRYTHDKHGRQNNQFEHLLTPKAGGIAFALEAMGGNLKKLLDVTIHYPGGIPSFWQFLCGSVEKVVVRINVRPIDNSLVGNYQTDMEFRKHFQAWLNEIWVSKDNVLVELNKHGGNV